METQRFLETLYFGDRGIDKFVVDIVNEKIEIHTDNISRVLSPNDTWDDIYKNGIDKAILVIDEVKKFEWDKSGWTPNDYINDIYAHKIDNKYYEFTIDVCGINAETNKTIILTIKIVGKGAYIVNPKFPNIKITE